MNRKSIIGILMMKLLDLFSGIGGFSLGMEATKKIKTIAFCEKDEFCRKVLKKHWSNIKQYNDIRSINGKEIAADIVSGGFPCQPFSVAGKRKGTEDDRYLWDEMLRVITEVKPRWVVGENVQGIINIDNGLVLRQVQTDLEAQGFQVQCLIIPASGVGAWHRRNRVWTIAYSSTVRGQNSAKNNIQNDTRKKTKENVKLGIKTSLSSNVPNSKSFGSNERKFRNNTQEKQIQRQIRGEGSIDVSNSNANTTTNKIQTRGNTLDSYSSTTRGESWWQIESELRGVPYGIYTGLDKDRANRIKALGNAIVPQIAYEIGQAILKAEYE